MTSKLQIGPDGNVYQAGNLIYRHAIPADDTLLQQILRNNPMEGWLRLALERSPSYFTGENLMGRSQTVIAQDAAKGGREIGMYHTTFLPVFINGKPMQGAYLGELRVNKAYRNRLRILKHGFDSIRPLNLPESATTPIWYTSIASDNHTARRMLEAKHQHLPRYTPIGELQTLAISVRHGRQLKLLQPATKSDIPALCEFYNREAAHYQFAPYLDPSWLNDLAKPKGLVIEDFWIHKESEDIEACIAVWDQRAFKQAVIQHYRFPLNHLRPLYNLLAYLQGKPCLPRTGCPLESIYLSFIAVSARAEKHATNILREALYIAGLKKAKLGLTGLSLTNPLLPGLISSLHPTIYRTCIETVSWADEEPIDLDIAAVQPEIAIL